jgi:hypothetical protein
MAEKFSVLIKYKYLEYIDNAKLSDTDLGAFMRGIVEYDRDGKDPIFNNPVLTALFAIVKIDLDTNKEKWEKRVNVNKENAKKGGRPPKTQETHDNPVEPEKPSGFQKTQETHDNPKNPDLDLDLDSEFENENEKESFSFSETPFDKNIQHDGKPPSDEIPDDKPIETKEDATKVWNKARALWNKLGLKPVCRDLMIRAGDTSEILRTFQFYSWAEIKDAIENYAWHKFRAGKEYRPPPPYGSLAGFLKTGVEKYFDENSLDQQFREER